MRPLLHSLDFWPDMCLCRYLACVVYVRRLKHCNYRRDAISRKDNHHDHTARHSAAAHTCMLALWAKLIVHAVCAAALCRVVWSWWLSFREIAESAPLQPHTFSSWDSKRELRLRHKHPLRYSHSRPRSNHLTLDLHFFLSLAQCLNSSHVFVTGASISRSPSLLPSYISLIALKRSLSSSSLKICPSHCSRRALMDRTRLNVHDSSIASWRIVLPVMTLSIRLFAPFIFLRIASVMNHASDPYVITEHTLAIYNRSLSRMCRLFDFHMWRILPNRCVAIATLRWTSAIWPPSASKTEPRYLKRQQLSASRSPHRTLGNLSCMSVRFYEW